MARYLYFDTTYEKIDKMLDVVSVWLSEKKTNLVHLLDTIHDV